MRSSNYVTLHCWYGGADLGPFNLTSPTYTGNPGSTSPWYVGYPGYIVSVDFWTYNGIIWQVTGATIAVAANDGYLYGPTAQGNVFSGRAGTVEELAVIGGALSICIATGTTNNWQTIHV